MRRSLSMKTFLAKKGEIEQKWLLVDAADQILGRLAVKIAMALMGKNKPTFTPYTDVGDFVIVVNAEKIKVTGNKADSKEYDYFTLHPGGHKYISYADMLSRQPEKVITHAVGCMMPKSKLGKQMMKKLKVYRGPEHDHQAQKPEKMQL
jgi:large subunit ribosomal protein L13